ILVTGGAGYIVSHACKALAARGFEPVAYDNVCRGNRWAVKWGPLEEGEIADGVRLREVLDRHRPAAVMHFAAYAYVSESVETPLLYYQNNVSGSAALFRAIVDWRVIPVVFSSTCATYGIPESVPIQEGHPQRPINPYGFSKMVVERMLVDLDQAHGLRSIALRYFNAAGADPGGDIGEAHDPEPHLIPRVLAAARDGAAVTVYGDDYETPDGTCIRDYIHVADIADAHVLALDHLLSGESSCALNLANAQGYSVMEVIETAERVCGKTIRVERAARRRGDPPVLVGSAERARTLLGWKPARSILELQIADAWRWMQRNNAP
ncbi:MAG: UDP-glucose 4-epimerase GalE, partial [Candidatus Sulfotelmatobacter sp.]